MLKCLPIIVGSMTLTLWVWIVFVMNGNGRTLPTLILRCFSSTGSYSGHLCAALPGQYHSTASSTEKKLFLPTAFLTWLLYNAQLDLLSSCAANGGVLLVGRSGLRRHREGENGRVPRGPSRRFYFFCRICFLLLLSKRVILFFHGQHISCSCVLESPPLTLKP
jgi:hypothetical protein